MASIDLNSMSEKELRELKLSVDKALSSLGSRRLAEARRAAEEAASKHGYSLSELVGGKPAKTKSAAKYRNPANESQTWSGHGRQPGWIKEGLAKGKKLADFAI
jgi:DNA-binding protein H-NS